MLPNYAEYERIRKRYGEEAPQTKAARNSLEPVDELELVSDYRTAYAKYGAYSPKTKLAANALRTAGINIPNVKQMYGVESTATEPSPNIVSPDNEDVIPIEERTGEELIKDAADQATTDIDRVKLHETFAKETLAPDKVKQSTEQYESDLKGESVPRVTESSIGHVGMLDATTMDEDELVESGYNASKLQFQRTSEYFAERQRHVEEEKKQYPLVGGLLFKRQTSPLEREYYDVVQKFGEDAPSARKLELEIAKRKLQPLTEESTIPFMRVPEGDTGFFAPPPKSLVEREKGLLDTLIAPLLLGEQASGTAIYALRKAMGFGGIDWIEEAEKGERFKEISPSMALGITTRETDIFTMRGVAGLAIDIVLDPTSYIGIGVIGKAGKFGSKLAKSARIVSGTGDVATVGKKGVRAIGELTTSIRAAQPHLSVQAARKQAEAIVYEMAKRNPEILAARKYIEPSLHFMGQPAYVVEPAKRLLRKAWEAAPLLKKRKAAVEAIRTAFVPFHKVRQAAGERAAEVFAKFYRATEYERGEWGKRAAVLAKKRPFFVKQASEQEYNKQVRQYLERGVMPTEPQALEEALEIRKGYEELFEREIEEGLITREQMRPDYMFHVLTPEAKEYLKKELGSEFREGEEAFTYMRQLESAHERTYTGTIDEINEQMAEALGGKKFFVDDPLKAFFLRGVESARAIESHKLKNAIMTGEWTKTVEELSPVAGRTIPKFDEDVIEEMVEKKYGTRIGKLREQIGIPEDAEVTTLEDILQYAKRDVTEEDLLKSIDEQIAETEKAIESGIWRSEEGVLGAKPDVVTTTQWHLTKSAKKAEEDLIGLRIEREAIRTGVRREEAITAFDTETVELYKKRSYEYLVEAGERSRRTREKLVDARKRLDELTTSKKVRDDYLEETRKKTMRERSRYGLLRETRESMEGVYEEVGKGRGVAISPHQVEDVLPPHRLDKYTKDYEKLQDLLHTRMGTEYVEPTAKEIESAQELLSPYVKYFSQQEKMAKGTYIKESLAYERLLKYGVPVDEIPAVKKQSDKVDKLESLLKSAEGIESEYAGAVIGIEKGIPIEDVLKDADVSKLADVVGTREAKRDVFVTNLDKKLAKTLDALDEAIATKTAAVEAGRVPPKQSGEYRKLIAEKDALVETREHISKFYADFDSLSPEELANEAKRISKLTGIAGEDKKLFTDIAAGVKLFDDLAKQSEYAAELRSKTKVAAPKKSVMVRKEDGTVEEFLYDADFGTYVPKTLIDEIEETVPVENMWTKHYDPFLAVLRKGYIGYWPSYYVRNVYSAAWQNMYRRVGVEDYAAAVATKYGPEDALIDLGPTYGKVPAKELKEMMEKQGVTGQIGFVDVPEMFMETGAIGGVSLTKGIQTVESSMQFAMKTTEDLARMPLYIKTMRQGGSPEQAAAVVRQFQFEYGAAGLTAFEKRKMKRAFLFYTWFRKNVPLQTQMLVEQPGTFAAAFKTREMMISPEEYNELPEWAKEGFARGGEGNRFYVMDVPLTDLPGLYAREELWFGVSPVAKVAMAHALGYDPSTKMPLTTPEEWGDFYARTFIGRYKSLYDEMGRLNGGEITPEDVAIHQLGGVSVGQYRGRNAKEAYKAARLYEWQPSEEDYIAAFEAAGPEGAAAYETLWKPEARPRGEVFTEAIPWYRDINWMEEPPWKWGQKEEYIGEKGIMLGLSAEQEEVIAGHRLTDEQKEEVKRIYEEKGAEFAAGYRTLMAVEYHEARAAIAGREPIKPTAITEAYQKLVSRVGKDAAQGAKVKTFYTTEGKPHVMMLTKEEAEDWGDWQPPQQLVDWLYEEVEGEVVELPLDEYEQYIKSRDFDYMLSPKERGEKRGRALSWRFERARAKVEEIKATIEEGAEPSQELIDAEDELREAQTAMTEFIRGGVGKTEEGISEYDRAVAEFDKEFWDYYEAAEGSGEIEALGKEEVIRQSMEFAERQTGMHINISPLERPKPTEEMLTEPFVSTGMTLYDQKFFEEYNRLKDEGMVEALGRAEVVRQAVEGLDKPDTQDIGWGRGLLGEEEVVDWNATLVRERLKTAAIEDEEQIKILGEKAVTRMATEFASKETGIPVITEQPTIRPLAEDVMKYLTEAYKETGFIPSTAQKEWALRMTEDTQIVSAEQFEEMMEERAAMGTEEYAALRELGMIKPIRMTFGEQIAIWSEEYAAKQKQEQLYREEYGELRADIRGTTKIRRDEYITTDLLLTRGAEDIGMRMSRKAELEEMLGIGVDR